MHFDNRTFFRAVRKLQEKRKSWLDGNVQRNHDRTVVRAAQRRQTMLALGADIRRSRTDAPSTSVFVAPSRIEAYRGEGRAFIKFLTNFVGQILVAKSPVHLDFSKVRAVTADGAIILLAEIDRCTELAGFESPISCTPPISAKVLEVFKQIGLCERLKIDNQVTPTREDVIHWHVATGKTIGKGAVSFVERFEGTIAPNALSGLAAGIAEALTNCIDHAYILPRSDSTLHPSHAKWWIFSQERDGILSVVVCDLGIGFRRSFPETENGKTLLRIARVARSNTISDEKALRIAVQAGRSRTGLKYRGKGIPQILEVIEKLGDGEMFIFSQRGAMIYKHQNGVPDGKRQTLKVAIPGTIIGWKIPIARK